MSAMFSLLQPQFERLYAAQKIVQVMVDFMPSSRK